MKKRDDTRPRLDAGLKELRLPAMRAGFAAMADTARGETLSYEGYLLALCEAECQERRHKRVERYLHDSRIPREKNLGNLELKRFGAKAATQVRSLLDGGFVGRKENLLAFGRPGSGKTHLLCAIGQELIHAGYRVYFSPCSHLVQDLLRAKKALKLAARLKALARYDALIIDDIGYVQHDRDEMEVLFTLLAERYERGSILLTSNLPFSHWERIFKDPMTTAAAIDRLVHHSVILELNNKSYRMAAAEEKQKGEKEKPKGEKQN
jgi:DNA replication protein DnaC